MKANRFYCENCHKEVKANARVCPHCGGFFTAVKCPKCGYTGGGEEFVAGCPRCGYNGKTEGDYVDVGREFGLHRKSPPKRSPVFAILALALVIAFIVLVVIYLNLD